MVTSNHFIIEMLQAIKTYQIKIKKRDLAFFIPKSRFFVDILAFVCFWGIMAKRNTYRSLLVIHIIFRNSISVP